MVWIVVCLGVTIIGQLTVSVMYILKCDQLKWRERDVEYYRGIWREACEQRNRLRDACEIAECKADDRNVRLGNALEELEQMTNKYDELVERSRKIADEKDLIEQNYVKLVTENERLCQRRPSNKEIDEYRKNARYAIAEPVGNQLAELIRVLAANQWLLEGSKQLRDAIESVSETACRISDEKEYS